MGGEAYLSGWLTGTSRDVLGGWEPSSARTQGVVIAKSLDATEDAAMRRLSRSAACAKAPPATVVRPGARGCTGQPSTIRRSPRRGGRVVECGGLENRYWAL